LSVPRDPLRHIGIALTVMALTAAAGAFLNSLVATGVGLSLAAVVMILLLVRRR
jgi:hypothetical protein